jgi:hypothetical protein
MNTRERERERERGREGDKDNNDGGDEPTRMIRMTDAFIGLDTRQ